MTTNLFRTFFNVLVNPVTVGAITGLLSYLSLVPIMGSLALATGSLANAGIGCVVMFLVSSIYSYVLKAPTRVRPKSLEAQKIQALTVDNKKLQKLTGELSNELVLTKQELQDLASHNNALASQLKVTEGTLANNKGALNELENEIIRISEEASESNQRALRAEEGLNASVEENGALRRSLQESQAQNHTLNEQLARHTNAARQLNEAVAEARQANAVLINARDRTLQELAQRNAEIEAAQEQLLEQSRELTEVRVHAQHAERGLAGQRLEIGALRQDYERVHRNLQAETDQLTAARSENEAQAREIEALRAQQSALESRIESQNQAITAATEVNRAQQVREQELNRRVDELSSENGQLTADRDQLQLQASLLRTAQQENQQLSSQVEALTQVNNDAVKANQAVLVQAETLTGRVASLEAENKQLIEKAKEREAELQSTKGEIKAKNEEFTKHQEEVLSIQNKLDAAKQETQRLISQLREESSKSLEDKKLLAQKNEEITLLSKNLEEANQSVQSLIAAQEETTNEIQLLKDQIKTIPALVTELEAAKGRSIANLRALKESNQQKTQALDESQRLQVANKQLSQNLLSMEAEISSLHSQLEHIKVDNEATLARAKLITEGLEAAKAGLKDADLSNTQKDEEIAKLKRDFSDSKTVNSRILDRLNTLTAENSRLVSSASFSSSIEAQLRSQVAELTAKLQQETALRQSLESSVAELEQELVNTLTEKNLELLKRSEELKERLKEVAPHPDGIVSSEPPEAAPSPSIIPITPTDLAETLKGEYAPEKSKQLFDYINVLAHSDNAGLKPYPDIEFVALKGGGPRGEAYKGVYQVFEEYGVRPSVFKGTSAGAITALLWGLRLNYEQFSKLTTMNFTDLFDYISTPGFNYIAYNDIAKAANYLLTTNKAFHSGVNAHLWIQAVLEATVGNKDITYAEYEQFRKENPALELGELSFRGTQSTKDTNLREVEFSYKATPNVCIADACRASMSLPVIFLPAQVRTKQADGSFEVLGDFTDGGMCNNFPIDDSLISDGKTIRRNEAAIGLDLSPLEEMSDTVSPYTDEIKALKESLKASKTSVSVPGAPAAKQAVASLLGYGSSEDIAKKKKENNVIELCTQGVELTDFGMTDERKAFLTRNAANSTKLWLEQRRAVDMAMPAEQQGHSIEQEIAIAKIERQSEFSDYLINEIKKSVSALHYGANVPAHQDIQCNDNQKLKYHSKRVTILLRAFSPSLEAQKSALSAIQQQHIADLKVQSLAQQQYKAQIDAYTDNDRVFDLINQLIKSDSHSDKEKAITLFKGQLTTVFKYENAHKTVQFIEDVALYGTADQLRDLITNLESNSNLLWQQSRMNDHLSLEKLLSSKRGSVFSFLGKISEITGNKNEIARSLKDKVVLLISKGGNPFAVDSEGKNLLHRITVSEILDYLSEEEAAELANSIYAKILAQQYTADDIHYARYGVDGDTIGHAIAKEIHVSSTNGQSKLKRKLTAFLNEAINFGGTNQTKRDSIFNELRNYRNETIENLRNGNKANSRSNSVDMARNLTSDQIQQLSDEGIKILFSTANQSGEPYLYELVKNNNKSSNELLSVIIKKAALVKSESGLLDRKHDGKSLLFCAIEVGNDTIVSALLSAGANPINRFHHDCKNALTFAASLGRHSTLDVITKAGKYNYSDLESIDLNKRTPSHMIAKKISEATFTNSDSDQEAMNQALKSFLSLAPVFSLTGAASTSTKKFSIERDNFGKTPFSYLCESPKAIVLFTQLLPHAKTSLFVADKQWMLDDLFDLTTEIEGFGNKSELAYLCENNKLLANQLYFNRFKLFRDPAIIERAFKAIYKDGLEWSLLHAMNLLSIESLAMYQINNTDKLSLRAVLELPKVSRLQAITTIVEEVNKNTGAIARIGVIFAGFTGKTTKLTFMDVFDVSDSELQHLCKEDLELAKNLNKLGAGTNEQKKALAAAIGNQLMSTTGINTSERYKSCTPGYSGVIGTGSNSSKVNGTLDIKPGVAQTLKK